MAGAQLFPSPRSQAKREQILLGARDVFLEQGYAGASTGSVAARAGVSKQTLYAYFPSKAALLHGLLERELAQLPLGGLDAPPAQSAADLRAHLFALASGVIARLLRPDTVALLRVLIAETPRFPEVRELLRGALPHRLLGQVTAVVEQAAQRGLLQAPQPQVAARLLVGGVMSYVALDGLLGPDAPRVPEEAELHALVDLFLRAVA